MSRCHIYLMGETPKYFMFFIKFYLSYINNKNTLQGYSLNDNIVLSLDLRSVTFQDAKRYLYGMNVQ